MTSQNISIRCHNVMRGRGKGVAYQCSGCEKVESIRSKSIPSKREDEDEEVYGDQPVGEEWPEEKEEELG